MSHTMNSAHIENHCRYSYDSLQCIIIVIKAEKQIFIIGQGRPTFSTLKHRILFYYHIAILPKSNNGAVGNNRFTF